ncbi:hypothetical protein HanOQP8_Chr01g0003411 [Helianthus annuus]|nr:hypothetical protein HanOQP8_Chr01g0003411 [Helianthus annuus]
MSKITERNNSGAYILLQKKCSQVAALQDNVITHIPGEGESSFEWHKQNSRNSCNKYDELECTSVFFEPLRWMKTGIK